MLVSLLLQAPEGTNEGQHTPSGDADPDAPRDLSDEEILSHLDPKAVGKILQNKAADGGSPAGRQALHFAAYGTAWWLSFWPILPLGAALV